MALHADVVRFFNGEIPGSPFGIKTTEWAFGTWLAGVDAESPPDGSITVDTIAQLTAGTGVFKFNLADNLASALDITQSTNSYLKFVTTNDLEKVSFGKPITLGVTATVAAPIDMAGAAHTLVIGTAGAAETKLVGNIVLVDANTASAPENLVLPAAASCTGMLIAIKNVGGEQVTVNTNVLTLEAGEGGFVISDGTAWAGFGVGANT
jgi:hypothetical protein